MQPVHSIAYFDLTQSELDHSSEAVDAYPIDSRFREQRLTYLKEKETSLQKINSQYEYFYS